MGSCSGKICARRRDPLRNSDGGDTWTPRWAGGRLQGEVSIMLLGLSGEELALGLSSMAPLRDVQQAIWSAWHIPIRAQQLILDGEVVTASSAAAIGIALSRPNGGEVQLNCIRSQLAEDEQYAEDCKLLFAVAKGVPSEILNALTYGANPMGVHGGPNSESASVDERRTPTPMLLALAAGDNVAIDMLHKVGAPEESLLEAKLKTSRRLFRCPLAQAFANRDLAAVVRCVGQGAADLNERLLRGEGIADTGGGTPLHACCAQHQLPGAAPVAELLCRMKANVNAEDDEGDSPLAHACYFGATEVAAVLRAHGAHVRGPYYRFSMRR